VFAQHISDLDTGSGIQQAGHYDRLGRSNASLSAHQSGIGVLLHAAPALGV